VKVLITGASGFVGLHFAEFLAHEHPSVEVTGLVRPHGTAPSELPGRMMIVEADIDDRAAVDAALDLVRPDRIVHLAAQSSPQASWTDPGGTLHTNVHGLLNVLEAVRKRSLSPRVLVIGSAEEYGLVDPKEAPLPETTPLRPASPYAVSKVAQGYLALSYVLSFQLGVLRTRTFHHTGPGRGESFAESSFARQIAEIEAGRRRPVLEVGNLEAVRDFTDVRDVVRAYWALLERGDAGEVYNVCSGKGVRIREVLEILINAAGLDVEVRVDPARLRPSDVPALVGDPRKLKAATGWEPQRPLAQTLADLLQYWRVHVGKEALRPAPKRAR